MDTKPEAGKISCLLGTSSSNALSTGDTPLAIDLIWNLGHFLVVQINSREKEIKVHGQPRNLNPTRYIGRELLFVASSWHVC
jgi:hypothetical protein